MTVGKSNLLGAWTKPSISSIRTGGQTGADRAALDAAIRLGIPYQGWIPAGRLAEDGVIPAFYKNLTETPLADVDQRTEWNVRDSEGTLVLSFGAPQDGTNWTLICCKTYSKPLIEFDSRLVPSEAGKLQFFEWLKTHHITCLNIAGPRESYSPGVVYESSLNWLLGVLS